MMPHQNILEIQKLIRTDSVRVMTHVERVHKLDPTFLTSEAKQKGENIQMHNFSKTLANLVFSANNPF